MGLDISNYKRLGNYYFEDLSLDVTLGFCVTYFKQGTNEEIYNNVVKKAKVASQLTLDQKVDSSNELELNLSQLGDGFLEGIISGQHKNIMETYLGSIGNLVLNEGGEEYLHVRLFDFDCASLKSDAILHECTEMELFSGSLENYLYEISVITFKVTDGKLIPRSELHNMLERDYSKSPDFFIDSLKYPMGSRNFICDLYENLNKNYIDSLKNEFDCSDLWLDSVSLRLVEHLRNYLDSTKMFAEFAFEQNSKRLTFNKDFGSQEDEKKLEAQYVSSHIETLMDRFLFDSTKNSSGDVLESQRVIEAKRMMDAEAIDYHTADLHKYLSSGKQLH